MVVALLPLLIVCFWECETSCFGVFAILVLPSTATNSEKNVSRINNWQICIRHSIYKKIILLFAATPLPHPYFFCFLAVTRTKVFQAKKVRALNFSCACAHARVLVYKQGARQTASQKLDSELIFLFRPRSQRCLPKLRPIFCGPKEVPNPSPLKPSISRLGCCRLR